MWVSVLGSFQLLRNGYDCTPTAPKPREVAALMLFNANRVTPVSALVRELWGDSPPRSARTTVQTYILHLRKVISGAAFGPGDSVVNDILVTKHGGYMFRVAAGVLDLHRFEDLSLRGSLALSRDEPQTASPLLHQALDLWTGPPLVDVTVGEVLEPKVRGLNESRLVTMEQRIEADLRTGRHREILAELAALTAEHPLNENLHEQFMRALHNSGRRSEALNVFHRLRYSMMEELGLEPSVHLHDTQRRILTSDGQVYT